MIEVVNAVLLGTLVFIITVLLGWFAFLQYFVLKMKLQFKVMLWKLLTKTNKFTFWEKVKLVW